MRILQQMAAHVRDSRRIVSAFTGFKVDFVPFKLCPFIFSASATLILAGTLL